MAVRRTRSRAGRPTGNSFTLQLLGAGQLADLGQRLKGADKTLAKELRTGLNRAAAPLRRAVRAEVPKVMPSGYAPALSRSMRMRTQIRTTRHAHVTISAVAKGRHENRHVRALEKGILRHPLFGDREWWYAQKIRPGFWSRPMRAGAPTVRRELIKVMSDVKAKIVKG